MNSKLGPTNIQTFGQDNPFIRDRSLSSLSKRSSEYSSNHNQNQNNNNAKRENYGHRRQYTEGKQTSSSKNKLRFQHGKMLKDYTNLQHSARQSYGLKQSAYMSSKNTAYFQSSSSKKSQSPLPLPLPVSFTTSPSSPSLLHFNQDSITYLLQTQSHSLSNIKQTISKDKQKLQRDFQQLKQSIQNIIQDFKLTISAQLDGKYQEFVDLFKWIKNQYRNYCAVKNKYWGERRSCIDTKYPGMINSISQIDNKTLLSNILSDLKDCKKHIDYTQFSGLQDKLLRPLLQSASNLTRQLAIQSYYKPEIAHIQIREIREKIQGFVHGMYGRIGKFLSFNDAKQQNMDNQQRIRQSPVRRINNSNQINKNIAQFRNQLRTHSKSKSKQADLVRISFNNKPQKQSQILIDQPYSNINIQAQARTLNQKQKQRQRYSSTAHTQFASSYNSSSNNNSNSNGFSNKFRRSSDNSDYISEQPVNKCNNNYYDQNENAIKGRSTSRQSQNDKLCFNSSKGSQQIQKKRQSNNQFNNMDSRMRDNLSQDNIMLQAAQSIVDRGFARKQKESQTALCIVYLKPNRIAVGTKSGTIKTFCTLTGTKLSQLHGHKASICSLTVLQNSSYLASGGDINCCQLIIWDNINIDINNKIYHNFQNVHKAAITSLLDLGDNKHIISGSFDCCINVYNYKKKEIIKSLQTGEKITALAKVKENYNGKNGGNGEWILSGNLNSQVCVWKIGRNCFNSISGLQKVKVINIGTYPYSIVPIYNDNFKDGKVMVTGKDQWIRIINLEQGSIEQVKKVQNCTQIIQIPQNNKNESIYLACHKNGTITTLPHQNPTNQPHQIGQGSSIIYNCGISPRSAVSSYQQSSSTNTNNLQQIFMVDHTNQRDTEIKVWNIVAKVGNKFRNSSQDRNLYSY